MTDMKNEIQKAFDMVDRRQNDAALQVIKAILAELAPPNRVEIPAARQTIYDWLEKARRGLAGEPEIVPPKAALEAPWPWCIRNRVGQPSLAARGKGRHCSPTPEPLGFPAISAGPPPDGPSHRRRKCLSEAKIPALDAIDHQKRRQLPERLPQGHGLGDTPGVGRGGRK